MKFDVVCGNPPYNFPKVEGKSSGNVIWPSFVKKAVNWKVGDKQFLVFVHPSVWRKPVDENSDVRVWSYLSDYICYLNINSAERGIDVFSANTRFDWYVWQKNGDVDKTEINDIKGENWEIDISNWSFLPNSNYDIIEKLIADRGEKRQKVIFDSSYHASRSFVVDRKDAAHRYPVVHSTATNNIKYTDRRQRGHFGVSKVIIGESGVGDPIIDMDGEYGMTQGGIGLVVSSRDEAEKMVKALKSNCMREILDAVSYSSFRIDHRVLQKFREDWYLIDF